MCGIVGAVSKNKINIDLMLDAIKHRGPDGHGVKNFISESNFNICLGHRRLSIIDVTEHSNQPFTSNDSNYTIIFNGEIYNYKELKNKYLTDICLKSSGDTEVVLELFCKYGKKSFEWLEGMFALCIYDQINSILYLCRDGIGIKPLYYLQTENELFFASEISSLKTIGRLDFSICPNAITEFFLNGFIYEPNTGFKNIKKVFPGCYIEISIGKNLGIIEKTFWKPTINSGIDETEIDLVDLVKNEYKSHLVSDVPIGLFFSGGIDSSVLLSLGTDEVVPYFINNKSEVKKSVEYNYAKKVANSLNRDFENIDLLFDNNQADKFVKSIEQVALKSEELIADYTFIVSELISRKAYEKGYKVMLSGMGGDEMFLGYPRYHLVAYKRFYYIIYIILNKLLYYNKRFSKKIDRFRAFFENKNFVLKYTNLIGYFQESELKELLVQFDSNSLVVYKDKLINLLKDYNYLSEVKQAQILDLYGFLSHNFIVADKSSMQASIEIRVPLATPKLFQNSLNTKIKNLMDFRCSKIPLLSVLNEKLNLKLFKRAKEGFNPDLDNLLTTIGEEKINELLQCEILLKYVKKDFIMNLLHEHKLGNKNNSYRIYQLLYFKFWLKHNT